MTIIDEIAERALEVFVRVEYVTHRTSTVGCTLEDASEGAAAVNLHRATRIAIQEIVVDESRLVEFYQELRFIYDLPGFSPGEADLIATLQKRLIFRAKNLFNQDLRPIPAVRQLLLEPATDATRRLADEREISLRLEGISIRREDALRARRETLSV